MMQAKKRVFFIICVITFLTIVASPIFPQQVSAQTNSWAFEENFDLGTPSAPQPFSSPRVHVIVVSNDDDGVMDGQTLPENEAATGAKDGMLEMGHGPHCEAPIGNSDVSVNNHTVAVDWNVQNFQTIIRPQLAYICNNHMMTVAKSGYGEVTFMPRQIFDWSGRTGTFQIDNNVFAAGREWWDVYVVPQEDMLFDMQDGDEGGIGEQHPKRAVKFKYGANGKASVELIDNYQPVWEWGNWQAFPEAFANDPANTDPRIRRTFRFQVSDTSWKYQIELDPTTALSQPGSGKYEIVDGKTYWTFSGEFPQPLSFHQGLVRFEHHAYNPTKDFVKATPWSQYTFHWDNIKFDGPMIPAPTAFLPSSLAFVQLFRNGNPDPNRTVPVHIQVPVTQDKITNAKLLGHLYSDLNQEAVDPLNSTGFAQFRVNGGPWTNLTWIKNISTDRTWTTFRNVVPNIISGDNLIEFRYPTRPGNATWQFGGFNIKDLEINVDPVSLGITPTPTPPTSPTVTPTPTAVITPTPTLKATPTPTSTSEGRQVTFDSADGKAGPLNGQYPSGIIDWGTGQWYISDPWGKFTTKSVSFTSSKKSSVFTFTTARKLIQFDAYNGGSATTTITILCDGANSKSFSLGTNAVQTIKTGWTTTCTKVTLKTTNGWDTNFDNFLLQ